MGANPHKQQIPLSCWRFGRDDNFRDMLPNLLGESAREGAAFLIVRRAGRCGEESATGCGDALPRRGSGVAERCLGGAATASGELANVVEEDGALQVVEL
jgi:hypothetical protein